MKNALLTLIFLLVSFVTHAFSIEPMVAELQPAGSKKQIMFKIKNDSNKPIPVQASALLISFDKKGNEINTETNDLLILPITATIAANKIQTFVVRYAANPLLPSSKSYRIAFETTDVKSQNPGNGIQMQYQFLTFVNVKPKNPMVNIVQKRTYQKGGKWYLELTNNGNTSAFLSEMNWQVGLGSNLKPISEQVKSKHINADFLLPGDTQSFAFKPFKGISPKSMKVMVSN